MIRISVEEVEMMIGIPAEDWPGHCHEIAGEVMKAGIVDGKLRYGHWLGPVDDRSLFANRPLIQHGWIEVAADPYPETIVDPTRWVFEGAEPYIYVGGNDYYDVGGNKFREENIKPAPPTLKYKTAVYGLSGLPYQKVKTLLFDGGLEEGQCVLSIEQRFWLCNLPLSYLAPYAMEIYTAAAAAGDKAFIPIDNWHFIMA